MSKNSTRTKKNSPKTKKTQKDYNFCPLCQIPLHFLKITGDAHLQRCEQNSWYRASECKLGIECFESDFHHYWDYTHNTLAEHRSLNYYSLSQKEENDSDRIQNEKRPSTKRKRQVFSSESDKSDEIIVNTPKIRKPRTKNNIKQSMSEKDNHKKPKRKISRVSSSGEEHSENENNIKHSTNKRDQKKKSKIKTTNKSKVLSSSDDSETDVFMINYLKQSFVQNKKDNTCVSEDKSDFTHFLYSHSQHKEQTYVTPNRNTKNTECENTTENSIKSEGKSNKDIQDIFDVTPTRYLDQEFREMETPSLNVFSLPKQYNSDNVDSVLDNFEQNTEKGTDIPLPNYSEPTGNVYNDTMTININMPIEFSSSDEDYEVDSESGEILFTDKYVDKDEQVQTDTRLIVDLKDAHDRPILQNSTKTQEIEKVNNHVKSVEQWKQLFNNKQKEKQPIAQKIQHKPTPPPEEPGRAPLYKLIPYTDFVVDGFKSGPLNNKNNYFLSHFHYDHYIGLNKHFNKIIHCSTITKKLLISIIKLNEKYIRVIDVNETKIINQVEVTAIDANHCPGALMFIFKTLHGNCYLHTGDFRADVNTMSKIDILKNTFFDKIYLDTTYCNPKYTFPSQNDVLKKLIALIEQNHRKYPNTLYVCGSYTIGKEKVYISIVEKMKWKIYVETYKRKILNIINNSVINAHIVDSPTSAKIHVIAMSKLNNIHHLMNYYDSFKAKFNKLVAIKPTGWVYGGDTNDETLNIKKISDQIQVYEVSYSEHSSFRELCHFVKFTKYKQIISTVNPRNNEKQVQMIESYIKNKMRQEKINCNTLDNYLK